MKTLSLYAAILFSIFSLNSFAQKSDVLDKKENIKVWGNCETCKKHIENAAKAAGAKTANWNDETKNLFVTYNGSKTSSVKIQNAIAAAGYDTQDFKGDNNVYNKLLPCCKYERNSSFASSISQTNSSIKNCKNMACCKDKNCCDKNGKCDMEACKDMKECKDMACCKS